MARSDRIEIGGWHFALGNAMWWLVLTYEPFQPVLLAKVNICIGVASIVIGMLLSRVPAR